jgi:glucan phosphorylase
VHGKRIPKPVPGRPDVPGITEAFAHRMMYSVAKDQYTARDFDAYQGLAYAARDRLMERWFRTQDAYYHAAVDAIARGPLEKAHPGLFRPVVKELLGSDRYFLCADFDAYVECQGRAAETYQRAQDWARMSVLNVAGMGRFSSDRTVQEYATDIWSAAPVRVELEGASSGRGTRREPRVR